MSDSDEDEHQQNPVDEMPPYKMRWSDMSPDLVEKAIKCKFKCL